MTDPQKRRRYLINPSFQLKYILLLMVWGSLVIVLFGLWHHRVEQQAVEAVVRDAAERAAIARGTRDMIWVIAGLFALSMVALAAIGFVMTHRIAGPVFVMSYFLELLSEGRFPPPRTLRRHDELKSFYAQFVEAIEAMKRREEQHLECIHQAVVGMRQALPHAPELARALQGLEVDSRKRRQALEEASPEPAAGTRQVA